MGGRGPPDRAGGANTEIATPCKPDNDTRKTGAATRKTLFRNKGQEKPDKGLGSSLVEPQPRTRDTQISTVNLGPLPVTRIMEHWNEAVDAAKEKAFSRLTKRQRAKASANQVGVVTIESEHPLQLTSRQPAREPTTFFQNLPDTFVNEDNLPTATKHPRLFVDHGPSQVSLGHGFTTTDDTAGQPFAAPFPAHSTQRPTSANTGRSNISVGMAALETGAAALFGEDDALRTPRRSRARGADNDRRTTELFSSPRGVAGMQVDAGEVTSWLDQRKPLAGACLTDLTACFGA